LSMEKPSVQLQDRVLKLPSLSELTPPLQKLLKFPLSPGFLVSQGWQSLRPPSLVPKSPYAAYWAPQTTVSSETRLRFVQIQADVVQVILEKCRKEQTTVTGLLHALAFMSFATRLDRKKAQAFEAGTPIDLRRFVNSPPLKPHSTMANLVMYFPHKFQKKTVSNLRASFQKASNGGEELSNLEQGLWSIARDIRKSLVERLQIGTKNNTLGLTKFVGDWRTFMKDEFKRPRVMSWEVSNLGVIDGCIQPSGEEALAQKQWTIDQAVFSQSATIVGPAYILSPISVKGGALTVCCTWQNNVVEETMAVGVAADLQVWLENLGTRKPLSIDPAR
jgi:hypothetical protein